MRVVADTRPRRERNHPCTVMYRRFGRALISGRRIERVGRQRISEAEHVGGGDPEPVVAVCSHAWLEVEDGLGDGEAVRPSVRGVDGRVVEHAECAGTQNGVFGCDVREAQDRAERACGNVQPATNTRPTRKNYLLAEAIEGAFPRLPLVGSANSWVCCAPRRPSPNPLDNDTGNVGSRPLLNGTDALGHPLKNVRRVKLVARLASR